MSFSPLIGRGKNCSSMPTWSYIWPHGFLWPVKYGSILMVVETYIYMGAICPGEMSDFTLNMVDIRNKTFFFLVLCSRDFSLAVKLSLHWLIYHFFFAWSHFNECWNVCLLQKWWAFWIYFLLGKVWKSRGHYRNKTIWDNFVIQTYFSGSKFM